MKNVLIIVLLVAVAILGFQLYRTQTRVALFERHTAPYSTKDHKNNDITVIDCPTVTGQHNDVCMIPISYLKSMSGASDYGMVVHRNWTIIWYGDSGEILQVHPLPGRDCKDHTQKDEPASDPNLTGTISPKGTLQYAQVTANSDHDGYCFKTTVDVTVNNPAPTTTTYDPHMFDIGQ